MENLSRQLQDTALFCELPESVIREELAAFLCVNRSALSHELSQMQQEELIQFRKNTFALCRRTCPQGAEEKHRYPKEGE